MDAKAKENAATADSLPQLKLTNKPTVGDKLEQLADFAPKLEQLVD
jgi:hypothetical protein